MKIKAFGSPPTCKDEVRATLPFLVQDIRPLLHSLSFSLSMSPPLVKIKIKIKIVDKLLLRCHQPRLFLNSMGHHHLNLVLQVRENMYPIPFFHGENIILLLITIVFKDQLASLACIYDAVVVLGPSI